MRSSVDLCSYEYIAAIKLSNVERNCFIGKI
jgi:hypothetical protein